MNVLGIFAQPSKIASSSCFLVFGGFLLIKVFTRNQIFSILLKTELSVYYGMVRILSQDKDGATIFVVWHESLPG